MRGNIFLMEVLGNFEVMLDKFFLIRGNPERVLFGEILKEILVKVWRNFNVLAS